MTIKHGCNAPRRGGECVLTIPCIECGYWEKEYPREEETYPEEQCGNCCFENTRRCIHHGYPEHCIQKHCEYKIGISALKAQENLQGTHLEWGSLKEHDGNVINHILEILEIECMEIQSRIESSAMGSPLSERERGRIIGMLDVRVKIKSLYTKEKK